MDQQMRIKGSQVDSRAVEMLSGTQLRQIHMPTSLFNGVATWGDIYHVPCWAPKAWPLESGMQDRQMKAQFLVKNPESAGAGIQPQFSRTTKTLQYALSPSYNSQGGSERGVTPKVTHFR